MDLEGLLGQCNIIPTEEEIAVRMAADKLVDTLSEVLLKSPILKDYEALQILILIRSTIDKRITDLNPLLSQDLHI